MNGCNVSIMNIGDRHLKLLFAWNIGCAVTKFFFVYSEL